VCNFYGTNATKRNCKNDSSQTSFPPSLPPNRYWSGKQIVLVEPMLFCQVTQINIAIFQNHHRVTWGNQLMERWSLHIKVNRRMYFFFQKLHTSPLSFNISSQTSFSCKANFCLSLSYSVSLFSLALLWLLLFSLCLFITVWRLKEILLILGNEGRVSGMDRIVRGVMIGRRAWPVVCVGLMNGEQGQSEWSWVAGHWAMQ